MKTAILLVILALYGLVPAASADTSNHHVKDSVPQGVPNPEGRVGGETIESATAIPGVPYSDSDDTCAFVHDYDEVCPYTGSLSPDRPGASAPRRLST